MDTINKYYLTGENLDKRIEDTDSNDREMVRFSRTENEFVFPECERCKVPKIIHIEKDTQKCDAQVTEEHSIVINELKNHLKNSPGLAKFERLEVPQFQRFQRSTSVSEEETDTLQNKQEILVVTEEHDDPALKQIEEHIANIKRALSDATKAKGDHRELILKYQTKIGEMSLELYKLKLSKQTTAPQPAIHMAAPQSEIHIEKQKVCPSWTEHLNYEPYKKQLENWNSNNKKDNISKYHEVLENLKKNDKIPGLNQYIAEIVCERLKNDVNPSVEKIIQYLDLKFKKTKLERVNTIIKELYETKNRNEKDPIRRFEMIEVLANKLREESIGNNLNFLMMCILIKQGQTTGTLTNTEVNELNKVITDDDDTFKGSNDDIIPRVYKEYKRLKIEGHRQKEEDAHYTTFNRESRTRNRQKYVPSNSKPNLWRKTQTDHSRSRMDAKSQSPGGRRFQPNQTYRNYFNYRDRSASNRRNFKYHDRSNSRTSRNPSVDSKAPSMENTNDLTAVIQKLDQKLDGIANKVNKLEKNFNTSNVGYTEAEMVDMNIDLENVYYTDSTHTSMIVDVGCPSTLSGKEILDRYIEENGLSYENLPVRNTNMVFRFGETKLHSDKCVNIPIKVKVIDENGIAGVHYAEVPTYRVNGKAPFLLGLNTMESWRAKIDIGQKKVLN